MKNFPQDENGENFLEPAPEPGLAAAVAYILSMLPNKKADRALIEAQALDLAPADETSQNTIRQLIQLTPVCYGVERKSKWWRIVRQALSPETAVRHYLLGFPSHITPAQKHAIQAYLVRIDFRPEQVTQALEDRAFVSRSQTGTTKPLWVPTL